MDGAVRRVCPFCGQVILLNRCSVYATGAERRVDDEVRPPVRSAHSAASPVSVGLVGLSDLDDFEDPGDDIAVVQRPEHETTPEAASSRTSAALLWSWTPPPPIEPARRGRWLTPPPVTQRRESPLKPLTDFPPERLPRRFCSNPQCKRALPPDLDERQAHILAIVGLNAAGKTHYLATAFTEAMNGDGLDVAGFREFEPDDETAERFYTQYYNHVYRDNRLFGPTLEKDKAGQKPLNFRARIEGGPPMLVMTHDIAGETLVRHDRRARNAGFVRRSSAVIFLLDPLEFDEVRARVPREDIPVARSIHQRDLLSATLRELEFEPGRQKVPVAVVISKADLLTPFLPAGARFLEPPQRRAQTEDEWLREMQESSSVVRELLIRLGQERLVRATDSYGKVSFHAVSALGGRPGADGHVLPHPRRVLEPLALVLWRLSTALS